MGLLTIAPADDLATLHAADGARWGFPPARMLDAGDWRVAVHGPRGGAPQVFATEDGFAALAGTLFHQRQRDADALPAIFAAFTDDPAIVKDAIGHFALAIYKHGRLTVFADRMGAFTLFMAPARRVISTSFLSAAATVARPRLDTQAIYEYVSGGAVLGDATMVEQVQRLPARAVARFGATDIQIAQVSPELPQRASGNMATLLDEADAILDRHFTDIVATTDGNISCALTGGYDSRLVLAQLRRKSVTPRLLVYGADTTDARVAREIAAGEGLPLDVRTRPTSTGDADALRRNFFHADGYHHEGLFLNDVDADGRVDRTQGGTAFLHGGGGEIFRNFFLLGDGPRSARDVVRAMYAKFDPRIFGAGFDSRAFEDAIAAKIHALTGTTAPRLEREVIEWLYPNFRCRAWFGRESSLNNAAGASLMPFYEPDITAFAARIPLAHKNHGAFEAALIARADPRLAGYGSQYGHNFRDPVPLKRRISEAIKRETPAALRPWLYGLRERTRSYPSTTMADATAHPVVALFNFAGMRNPLVRSRALSVAYLAAWLGA